MVVLEPLKITIENYPHNSLMKLSVPNFPNKPDLGSHEIIFDKTIYIEKSDFSEVGDRGYRRLTKTQPVGLRYAGYILEVKEIQQNSEGEVSGLICTCTSVEEAKAKPKAFIHWVSQPSEVEVRLYSSLFNHKNPEDPNEVPGGFISDCNLNSLKIVRSFADKSILTAKIYDKYQFERIGFFCVDHDSTQEKLVFNQTVSLKEDTGK